MLRRTQMPLAGGLACTRVLLSGGGGTDLHNNFKDKEYPNMPHEFAKRTGDLSTFYQSPFL